MTGRMFMLVAWICVFLTQSVESQTPDCPSPRGGENCEGCLQPDLDLSTGCTTCVEQGPIECTPGQQGCGVGDFTFSALFHSYSNPEEMCGECGANGETVTCQEANGGGATSCRFRFLYCLQPYSSPPANVTFPLPQSPLDLSGSANTHNFMEDFITQDGGSNTRNPPTVNNWNRSNPFTRELQTWPGQVQFYVVTYHFTTNPAGNEYVYVDRVPIDLQLNISTEFTERRTYSGIHNISQFDISFRLSGQCAENYYGPQCAVFCSEVAGVSTCDSDGNIVCVDPEGDPQNNCETCVSPRDPEDCTACINTDLDLSTGCTTCVEQGPIECTPGQQGCGVGSFTFSALFHFYDNPTRMCGECGMDGGITSCGLFRGSGNCFITFIYCLQPYGSEPIDVTFPLEQRTFPIADTSSYTFDIGEGFFVQETNNINSPQRNNFWNRSNPFTRELQTWPGQVQFYILTYDRITDPDVRFVVVDRVPIDLQLNLSAEFTERRTYSGIHNISQFDMSFRLSGQCAENYYGPRCAIFCSEVTGVSTCDSDGNIVCVHPEGDPQNNCEPPGSVPGSSLQLAALVGGVLGGLLVVALLVIVSLLLLLGVRRNKHKEGTDMATSSRDEKIEMTQNQLYGVRTAEEDIKMEPVYETPEEKMEMTQNQLYGVRSTGDNITMEANVVYEAAKDKSLPPTTDTYDYVQT